MAVSIMDNAVVDTFGQRIRLCRNVKGLSKIACADALGISVVYLNVLESDRRGVPSIKLLRKMAVYLGVTTSQLLGETALV